MLLSSGSIFNLMDTLDFIVHCISFFAWVVRKLRDEFSGTHLRQGLNGDAFHILTASLASS